MWIHDAVFFYHHAGFTAIVNYLLNYYPALEIEKRDVRGLTALMKAAIQGQVDCVSALLMAGIVPFICQFQI